MSTWKEIRIKKPHGFTYGWMYQMMTRKSLYQRVDSTRLPKANQVGMKNEQQQVIRCDKTHKFEFQYP
jgi:hypothetical protein